MGIAATDHWPILGQFVTIALPGTKKRNANDNNRRARLGLPVNVSTTSPAAISAASRSSKSASRIASSGYSG